MQERWRAVPGFGAVYDVSDLGRFRRVYPGKATKVGRELGVTYRKNGRGSVTFTFGAKRQTRDAHAVVAEAFLGPCPSGLEINHKDGNPRNNELNNLEYCSHLDNMRHAYRMGLVTLGLGAKHRLAKLTTDQIMLIRQSTAPTRLIARVLNVSPQTIRQVRQGVTWKHV